MELALTPTKLRSSSMSRMVFAMKATSSIFKMEESRESKSLRELETPLLGRAHRRGSPIFLRARPKQMPALRLPKSKNPNRTT